MGKADQKKTQSAITEAKDASDNQSNAGIGDTQSRVNDLMPRADQERANILSGFGDIANTGGVSQADIDRLRGVYNGATGSGGSSGGGGGSSSGSSTGAANGDDYLATWREMMGATGGFDPTRLSNITNVANQLRTTRGNYGATDTSVTGLQDFAKSGGVSADNISKIDNPTLEEFSQTGGYSDTDKANIRSRGNSAVASTYANLGDKLNVDRIRGNNIGPGWGSAGFKLARQAAQDTGTNIRDTELGINNAVREGRMNASSTLADKILGLSQLQSANTLSGYQSSGALDLQKQKQIEDALAASGGLDLNSQALINNSRLAATGGLSQDTLGRMQISASSSAAAANRSLQEAALRSADEKFIMGLTQQGKVAGNQGLLSAYGTGPAELMFDQNLLRGYRQDQFGNNNDLIHDRISASNIPGVGSSISSGLNIAGQVAGIGSGLMGGFGGLANGNTGISGYGSGDFIGYNPEEAYG